MTQLFQSILEQPLFGQSTHEGAVGKQNEDCHGAFVVSYGDSKSKKIYTMIVADGVTSESDSKQASKLAVKVIRQVIESEAKYLSVSPTQKDIHALLEQAVTQADQKIKKVASHSTSGMSTTVVVALVIEHALYIVHVGDSRAYLYRDQALSLLTRDHTYAEEMVLRGKLAPEEAKRKSNRNVLTRYLGPGSVLEVDHEILAPADPVGDQSTELVQLQPGDLILLCSDGLTDKVVALEISRILYKTQYHLQRGTNALIQAALKKNEHDNITATLFRVGGQPQGVTFYRTAQWTIGILLIGLGILLTWWILSQLGKDLLFNSGITEAPSQTVTSETVTSETVTSESAVTSVPAVANTQVTEPDTPLSTATSTLSPTPTATPLPPTATPTTNQDGASILAESSTSTPIPIATRVPTVTPAIQPVIEEQAPVIEAIPTTLGGQKPVSQPISPTLSLPTDISIIIIRPDNGATLTNSDYLEWQSTVNDLPPNQAFEPIYWVQGQAPLDSAVVPGVMDVNDADIYDEITQTYRWKVDLSNLNFDVTYEWGILLVEKAPYERKAVLSEPRTFRLSSSGNDCPSGERDAAGNCLN